MKPIIKGLAVLIGIAALTIAGAGSITAEGPDGMQPPDILEGPTGEPLAERGQPPSPIARIQLANDETVSFYQFTESDGQTAFAISGEGKPGKPSLMDKPEMAKANPLEVFNAVSQPGTSIPRQFTDRYGQAKLGPQGWLLGAIEPTAHAINWCNTNTFEDNVESWNYQHTLLRLNERPADHPERWAPQTVSGDFYFTDQAWKYQATVYNVDQFYTRVAICDLDGGLLLCTNPFSCTPYGPWIEFRYRDHNNNPGSWGVAFSTDVSNYGVGTSVWWYFYTGVNWDWRVGINGAEDFEKFNIGLTWSAYP